VRTKRLRCLITAIAILAMVGGGVPSAIAWSGTTYYEAEIIGKVMSPANSDQPAVVYGDLKVKNSKWKWQTLSTGKFYKVSPKSTRTRQALNNQVGKGVRILGSYNSSFLQRGGLLTATYVEAKEIKEGPPQLTSFGVFRNPGQAVGIEIKHPVDFVTRLAVLRDTMIGMNGELSVPFLSMSPEQVQKFVADADKDPKKKGIKTALNNEWRANWKTQNFVERDLDAYNAALATARSVSFATGWAGTGLDALLDSVPGKRKDIEKAMLGNVKGGPAPDQEGAAVMLARISSLDIDGFKLYWVEGPLFDTSQGLAQGIVSANERDGQTWRAQGMNPKRAEALEGKVCWVSGSRVIVRDLETGAIVDKYFAVDKTMTYQETVSAFNLIEQLAKQGGI